MIEYLEIAFENINQDWVEREVTSDAYLDEYFGLVQPDLQSMTLCRRSSDYHGQTTISEVERQNHVADVIIVSPSLFSSVDNH